MKLGAFVLTYNRPDAVERSIETLLSQTRPPDRLLVVENGDPEPTAGIVKRFADQRLVLEATGQNLGSAGGTAYGYRWLYEHGFDLLYCGDDDNPPRTPDTVEQLFNLLQRADTDVGGTGCVGARWNWSRGELERLSDEALEGVIEVDFIGGDHKQLLRREVIESVGPPDQKLFFGYPDLEHCLRIRRAGYRLIVDGDLMLRYREVNRRLGLEPRKSALPRRSYEGIWRNYYTTRNYIFMMRKTFCRPDLARRQALKAMARSIVGWARGPRYGARLLAYQLRGVIDGYRGRMGATLAPESKQ